MSHNSFDYVVNKGANQPQGDSMNDNHFPSGLVLIINYRFAFTKFVNIYFEIIIFSKREIIFSLRS